jgi:outer membrane immunogenic protein
MTKLPVAAGLALALVAGTAIAADLPSRKEPPLLPPPPAPVFTWTGLYGGVNVGYGFNAGGSWRGVQTGGSFVAPVLGPAVGGWYQPTDLNGVLGGGQIGYNYQFSPWLTVGVEADIQAADLNHNTWGWTPLSGGAPGDFGYATGGQHVDWFGTVRGRVGLTMPSWPNLMVFGSGGFAYGGVNDLFSYSAGSPLTAQLVQGQGVYDSTKTGWAAGGGVEYTPMAFPSWSLKLEYLYTDLGTVSQNVFGLVNTGPAGVGPGVFAATNEAAYRWHTVRAGVNWHFNPFGSTAPILAKY